MGHTHNNLHSLALISDLLIISTGITDKLRHFTLSVEGLYVV